MLEVGDVYYQAIKEGIWRLDGQRDTVDDFSHLGYSPCSLWNELYSDVMKDVEFCVIVERYKNVKFVL
jgi:hypothetical protein